MTELHDDVARSRYELPVEGAVAYVDYHRADGVVRLLYAKVPDHLAGRGIGAVLARAAFERVRAEGLKAQPVCSYLVAWARRHPDVHDLLGSPAVRS